MFFLFDFFRVYRKHEKGTDGKRIEEIVMGKRWNHLLWTAVFLFEIISVAKSEEVQEFVLFGKALDRAESYATIEEDSRRPIWNVAHMVNSIWQVDYYLNMGANSLEFDVTFDYGGNPIFTFHGVPCDCFRHCLRYEQFDRFLDYLRTIATPGTLNFRNEFIMLFMDLKISRLPTSALMAVGNNLARKLINIYWRRGESGAQAYVLISLPSINQIDVVKSVMNTLQSEDATFYNEKIGFDFSGNEDLDTIQNVLNSVQVTSQVWQGDGITNCLPRGTSRLLSALNKRDELGNNYLDKVYWWTVDKMATMRRTLSLGVDGMITNYPQRLIQVLGENEYSKTVRLATIADNPWKKYPRQMRSLVDVYPRYNHGNITGYVEEEILYNS